MVAMMILLSNEDERWQTDEDAEEDIEMTYKTIVVSKVNDCYISDVSWRKEEPVDSSRQLKERNPPGLHHIQSGTSLS